MLISIAPTGDRHETKWRDLHTLHLCEHSDSYKLGVMASTTNHCKIGTKDRSVGDLWSPPVSTLWKLTRGEARVIHSDKTKGAATVWRRLVML